MKKKLPEHPFNEDYPFMVVPLNENEEKKAKAAGIPSTFCNSELGARKVMNRQNRHSGILWKVRATTENDKLNWEII